MSIAMIIIACGVGLVVVLIFALIAVLLNQDRN